jgi:putative flippase GtrA
VLGPSAEPAQRRDRPRLGKQARTPHLPSLWASTLQVRRFATVGLLNTAVDYVLFVTLTKALHLPLAWVWVAKLVSGTVAISISFYLNRRWVFQSTAGGHAQAARFVITTLVGVYGIQTSLTQLFASTYTGPGRALFVVFKNLGLHGAFPHVATEPLAIKTGAFAVATAVSMTFNFLLYRYWVFRATSTDPSQRISSF